MLTRRTFLERAAMLVAAGVAADQLELLERLAPRRNYVSGWRAVPISYEVKMLNSFSLGYAVAGSDWRGWAGEEFAEAARLSGREVRYDLVNDIYQVSARTKQPWIFEPAQLVRPMSGPGPTGMTATRVMRAAHVPRYA